MDLKTLTLGDREKLESRFKSLALEISEYTFANLYLFRDVHQYQILTCGDLYIKGKTRRGFPYLMLTSSPENLNLEELKKCLTGCDFIFPVPEKWIPYFNPLLFESSFLEEDSDYLYSTSQMSTYAGRHLSGRRNLVHQFQDLFPNHREIRLAASNHEDAFHVLEEWHQHAKEEPFTDYTSCKEALHLMKELNLSGLLVYVDDKPVAFLIGEPLTDQIYVIHFAKALIEYKGIYQYLYQAFAKSIAHQFQYINLEQDLGSIDLKHAKRAYQPQRYAAKFRIKLKKESPNGK